MTSDKAYTSQQRLDTLLGAQTDWAGFGSFTNGWSKASGGAQYRRDLAGNVHVQMWTLVPGTTTNGTTIVSAANGLPAGFRLAASPGFAYFPVRCDIPGSQTAAFRVDTDGHLECFGIAVTATRVDCYFTFFAET